MYTTWSTTIHDQWLRLTVPRWIGSKGMVRCSCVKVIDGMWLEGFSILTPLMPSSVTDAKEKEGQTDGRKFHHLNNRKKVRCTLREISIEKEVIGDLSFLPHNNLTYPRIIYCYLSSKKKIDFLEYAIFLSNQIFVGHWIHTSVYVLLSMFQVIYPLKSRWSIPFLVL